jgi:uncharacterized protein YndB with AHSA1/START domain
MALPTPDAARQTRGFIKAAGGNATWDRLAEYLEAQSSHDAIFVINRSFDAPIASVFEMFATPEHFAAWLPPVGFTMTFRRANIAPGGEAVFAMTNGEFTMYGRLDYSIVERPHRLVYSQVFVTEHEQPARYPGDSAWPETITNSVELTEEGPAQTRAMHPV